MKKKPINVNLPTVVTTVLRRKAAADRMRVSVSVENAIDLCSSDPISAEDLNFYNKAINACGKKVTSVRLSEENFNKVIRVLCATPVDTAVATPNKAIAILLTRFIKNDIAQHVS